MRDLRPRSSRLLACRPRPPPSRCLVACAPATGSGPSRPARSARCPGCMLLPYLTDTLGVAAALAGVIVFAPKAWDVFLNPVAGRISDRSTDPRGPRRPFLLRGGLSLAVCFALLFAGPSTGSTAARRALGARDLPRLRHGVRVLPGAVRRDAGGDDRRLRRAHPADDLAGRPAGADDPAHRGVRAGGPRRDRRARRLPRHGPARRRRDRRSAWSASYVGTRSAPVGTRARDRRLPAASSCGSWPRPATSGCCSPPSSCRRWRWARCSPASTTSPGSCSAAAARRRCCSSASSDRRSCSRRCGRAWGNGSARRPATSRRRSFLAAGAVLLVSMQVVPSAVVYARHRAGRRRLRRSAGVPDGDAARRGGGRRAPHRREPGRRLHRRLDGRGDPRAGARPRASSRWCWRSAATCPRPRGPSPSRTRRSPRSRSASRCCRPCWCCCRWCGCSGYRLGEDEVRAATAATVRAVQPPPREGSDDRRPARAARASCRPATCRRRAAARWPTSTTAAWPTSTRSPARRWSAFADCNGLDPTAFPSLLRMENELVGFAADLLRRPPRSSGR